MSRIKLLTSSKTKAIQKWLILYRPYAYACFLIVLFTMCFSLSQVSFGNSVMNFIACSCASSWGSFRNLWKKTYTSSKLDMISFTISSPSGVRTTLLQKSSYTYPQFARHLSILLTLGRDTPKCRDILTHLTYSSLSVSSFIAIRYFICPAQCFIFILLTCPSLSDASSL